MRFIFLFIFCSAMHSYGQFVNPSFEQSSALPQFLGEWNKVAGWRNAGSESANPDYYKVGASAACDLPETPFAVMNAHNGNSMMGMALCGRKYTNKRTYLQTEFQQPLVRGKRYRFSFYLSNGTITPTSSAGLATDHIGAYISSFAPVQTNTDPLYFESQFFIDTVFYSTTWRKISFEYNPLADGEKFFTLGVFGSDTDRDIVVEGDGNPEVGYYFVDSFSCVEITGNNTPSDNAVDKGPSPDKLNFVFVPNSFTPNGDGQNDVFMPVGERATIVSVEVFSRWGEIIFQSKNISNPIWDGTKGKEVCPDGTYFFVVKYEIPNTGEIGTQSGYVTLLH